MEKLDLQIRQIENKIQRLLIQKEFLEKINLLKEEISEETKKEIKD
jgi:hypothetical protein